MKRRSFVKGLAISSTLGLANTANAVSVPNTAKKSPILLIHGAWSHSHHYAKILPLLVQAGHLTSAIDLPGHGYNAKFPRSYFKRPLDRKAFATEVSPLKHITLQDSVDSVVKTINAIYEQTGEPLVLIGHSFGGVAVTAAAEVVPEKIKKLIYIAAMVPTLGLAADDYFGMPEARGGKNHLILFPTDYNKIGAIRMDPRSEDPKFRQLFRDLNYHDMPADQYEPPMYMLTADTPRQPFSAKLKLTKEKWGSLKRTYIVCTLDRLVSPLLQDVFIKNADKFTPENKFEVIKMANGHNPAITNPHGLVEILLKQSV